jgi:hypothetical protein
LFVLDTTGLYPVNPTVRTWAAIYVILQALLIVIALFTRSVMHSCRQRGSVWRWTGAVSTSLASRARNAQSIWRLRGYPEYTIPKTLWKVPKTANRILRDDMIITTWKWRGHWMGLVYGWDRHGTIHAEEYAGCGSRSYDDILNAIRLTAMWDVRERIRRANATPMGQK